MCTYNGSRFLDEQLSSIERQERPPDEMVVCDDGSGDDTVAKLQEFASRSSFPVRIVVNENNLGTSRNFEKAISLCASDIIALSDFDDIWYGSRLQKTEEAFVRHPSAGVVFGDGDIIGPDSSLLGSGLWKSAHFGRLQRFQFRSHNATRALLRHNVVTGATMAFRSSLREMVLPLPDIWIHDGWIALIASFFSDIVALNQPLIRYRKHPDQKTGFLYGLVPELARAGVTSHSHYYRQVQQYESAYERLLGHVKTEKQKKMMKWITAKIRHSSVRAHMPVHKVARIPFVLQEFATMRYTLYSRGLLSAWRDLLL